MKQFDSIIKNMDGVFFYKKIKGKKCEIWVYDALNGMTKLCKISRKKADLYFKDIELVEG